jgi:DENN (AEX-3) domain
MSVTPSLPLSSSLSFHLNLIHDAVTFFSRIIVSPVYSRYERTTAIFICVTNFTIYHRSYTLTYCIYCYLSHHHTASGLITAITTAFLLLLKPFQWAGIFVPVLPRNALEVMEAPVPFIGNKVYCTVLTYTVLPYTSLTWTVV